jgi:predicted amidohydrolase
MEKFRVASVQMNALMSDLDHNIEVHDRIAREAADDKCRLVMFPELSVTSHFGATEASDLAEPSDSGRIFETMRDLAKELDIVISYGFCEIANGSFYNSQALMGPHGLIGVQRKVHASGDEYFYFRMGREFHVFDLGFCKIGTLICFDVTFFESWRVMALKGAELLLLPHAARSGRGEERTLEEQKKQIRRELDNAPAKNGVYGSDNGVFGVFANQFGYNGHSTHGGGTYIYGPDGELLAKGTPKLEDQWIAADIDPEVLHDARARKGTVMRCRRPEVYGEISRMI